MSGGDQRPLVPAKALSPFKHLVTLHSALYPSVFPKLYSREINYILDELYSTLPCIQVIDVIKVTSFSCPSFPGCSFLNPTKDFVYIGANNFFLLTKIKLSLFHQSKNILITRII